MGKGFMAFRTFPLPVMYYVTLNIFLNASWMNQPDDHAFPKMTIFSTFLEKIKWRKMNKMEK